MALALNSSGLGIKKGCTFPSSSSSWEGGGVDRFAVMAANGLS